MFGRTARIIFEWNVGETPRKISGGATWGIPGRIYWGISGSFFLEKYGIWILEGIHIKMPGRITK